MEKWENWCSYYLDKGGCRDLRYRTKDLTSLMEGECPCGRTNIHMSGIVGRSDVCYPVASMFFRLRWKCYFDMPQFEPPVYAGGG